MVFKNFRINVIIRVVLLALAMLFFIHAIYRKEWVMTTVFAGGTVLGLTIELIYYVEQTTRNLRNFLMAIKHKDFTHSFSKEKRGKPFYNLNETFNLVIKGYQDLRAEKESHYLYLQNIIEHVSVALICYMESGEIQLMNQAAHELLDRPYMSHIRILDRVDPKLSEEISNLTSGERKLVKAVINEELHHLAIQATTFKLQEESFKLISLQDIQTELDEKEVETWHKLIRVLTHEIMNSVTPIISLTKVINLMLTDKHDTRISLDNIDDEDADDLLASVRTIESRSKGLLHFVHAYRNLTNVSKPKYSEVNIEQLLSNVLTLLKPELEKRNIVSGIKMDQEDLIIQADSELIEQVLINLIKNAMEALEGKSNPRIYLTAHRSAENKTFIQVIDNGMGIDQEFADKLFIPFFTTKKQGSGIGLSLSRQIMRLHKGTINFQSTQGEGTTFTLTF